MRITLKDARTVPGNGVVAAGATVTVSDDLGKYFVDSGWAVDADGGYPTQNYPRRAELISSDSSQPAFRMNTECLQSALNLGFDVDINIPGTYYVTNLSIPNGRRLKVGKGVTLKWPKGAPSNQLPFIYNTNAVTPHRACTAAFWYSTWITGKVVVVGQLVWSNGNIYKYDTGGTTATAPTGTNATVGSGTDGTATYHYFATAPRAWKWEYWQAGETVYQFNNISNGYCYRIANGNIYVTHNNTGAAITCGNTAPTGTGTSISDGACLWDYVSSASDPAAGAASTVVRYAFQCAQADLPAVGDVVVVYNVQPYEFCSHFECTAITANGANSYWVAAPGVGSATAWEASALTGMELSTILFKPCDTTIDIVCDGVIDAKNYPSYGFSSAGIAGDGAIVLQAIDKATIAGTGKIISWGGDGGEKGVGGSNGCIMPQACRSFLLDGLRFEGIRSTTTGSGPGYAKIRNIGVKDIYDDLITFSTGRYPTGGAYSFIIGPITVDIDGIEVSDYVGSTRKYNGAGHILGASGCSYYPYDVRIRGIKGTTPSVAGILSCIGYDAVITPNPYMWMRNVDIDLSSDYICQNSEVVTINYSLGGRLDRLRLSGAANLRGESASLVYARASAARDATTPVLVTLDNLIVNGTGGFNNTNGSLFIVDSSKLASPIQFTLNNCSINDVDRLLSVTMTATATTYDINLNINGGNIRTKSDMILTAVAAWNNQFTFSANAARLVSLGTNGLANIQANGLKAPIFNVSACYIESANWLGANYLATHVKWRGHGNTFGGATKTVFWCGGAAGGKFSVFDWSSQVAVETYKAYMSPDVGQYCYSTNATATKAGPSVKVNANDPNTTGLTWYALGTGASGVNTLIV